MLSVLTLLCSILLLAPPLVLAYTASFDSRTSLVTSWSRRSKCTNEMNSKFIKLSNNQIIWSRSFKLYHNHGSDTIVSPFDPAGVTKSKVEKSGKEDHGDDDDDDDDDELPLTRDNVERVLDEMRPYLKSDGGDVKLTEIDGPVVKLELVGACGTCPSSSMTMKMGLERRLKERIPEIAEVVQSLPNAPVLTNENIEIVLDGVRPFLSVAGGNISIAGLSGVGGLQPVVTLKMDGTAASLQSVKLEIMQRIQRHFMQSLRIEWV